MKKHVISGLAALSLLALVACNEETDAPVFNSESQVFTISVANKDAVPTRAGRPLYSQAYEQDIDFVKFTIVRTDNDGGNQNQIVYADVINTWMTNSNVIATADGHGRQTTIELKGENKLVPGTYKAYAVGYSDGSSYTDLTTDLAGLAVGEQFNPISVVTDGDAEEIFAGGFENGEFEVVAGKGFSQSIVLKRQVAGTYGYFTNIPAKGPKGEDAKYLRLIASNKMKEVIFDGFDQKNAVNGKNSFNSASEDYFDGSLKGYEVYRIDLNQWFPSGDTNANDMFDAGDTGWRKDPAITEPNVSFETGSVFGGKFLVPFKAVNGTNTLQLQLLDESDNILKYWNVNLKTAQTVNVVEGADNNEVAESTSVYSILRNQLYTIGVRAAGDDGGENPDPEEGDDTPEDLSKGQELIIVVDGAWENIPGMELD